MSCLVVLTCKVRFSYSFVTFFVHCADRLFGVFTKPGSNGRKSHEVPAAASTSFVSIPGLAKIIASSLTKAMIRIADHGQALA